MAEERTRRQGPRSVAEAFGRVTASVCERRGFAGGVVIADWAAIVGARLAAESAPERLRFPPKQRRGGTLDLRIANSGLALELQHLQTQLIERINSHFGYDAVARIRFVHGPITERADRRPPRTAAAPPRATPPDAARDLAALLAGIDDAELREALAALGRAVFSTEIPTSAEPTATAADVRRPGATTGGPSEPA